MKNDIKNDMKLYELYLNGDNTAFEKLYQKYKNNIQYFIFNIVKDNEKAEDLTQDVFTYILNEKEKRINNIKYSLYLIAKSKALTYINSENRQHDIKEKYIYYESNTFENDIIDIITKNEEKSELLTAINSLDHKYRNALYLIYFEGLSYNETAKILNLSLANLKTIIHRGKKILKQNLIKKGNITMNNLSRKLIILFITAIMLTGITYATVHLYNYFEYTNKLETNDFKNSNDFLYKKIYNYNDYQKYKSNISSTLEIVKEDFENNFLLIIVSERTKLNGLQIDNYRIEDDVLQIELVESEFSMKDIGNAILIDKKMDKNKINIEMISKDMQISSYIDIKKLPNNYSKEQAISDKCLVIVQDEKKTYNKNILDDFVNNVTNRKNAEIRIYDISGKDIRIQDIQYISNQKFIICYDYTRYSDHPVSYETHEINTNDITITHLTNIDTPIELYNIKDKEKEFTFSIYN